MPRLYTNTDCPLHGSEYCARLHMESCDTCTVRGRDEEEMQLLKQDLDAIAAMMPEEGIAALFLTLRRMKRLGWFELYETKDVSRLVFSKKPFRQGLYTGASGHGTADKPAEAAEFAEE